MDWFVKRFLQAALVWLGLGVTLGVAMAVYPLLVVYRPAHFHMNLLGFVTMMIFGVGYHVIANEEGNTARTPGGSARTSALLEQCRNNCVLANLRVVSA